MEITVKRTKTILTPTSGFLASGPHPYTHALSPYTGCGFGQTTCGLYCYAQFQPNWRFSSKGAAWGDMAQVKENAGELLAHELSGMSSAERQGLRIYLSPVTDPYQPIERQYAIMRRCMEVFVQYLDIDLLVIQTRSPLATRDFDLLAALPYVWLSVTIETNDQEYLKKFKGGPSLVKRFEMIRLAHEQGINTQLTVTPCMPYTSVEEFGTQVLESGAQRIIVGSTTGGEEKRGARTARSPFAKAEASWADTRHAEALFEYVKMHAGHSIVNWSQEGFCGIPSRYARTMDDSILKDATQLSLF